ncbi:MAG: hypothetical protein ACE5KE_13400 [Methanosarcinales archaeon]
MSEVKLNEIFENSAIEDFGSALRKAIRENDDYASLVELEYVESPEEFAEVIKKFLRRYESYAKKYRRKRPTEESLDKIMGLVDQYGVRLIRSALISHALVKSTRVEEESEYGSE